MNGLMNNHGVSRVKVFLWFLVLYLVAYAAIKIVPPYMDYARMKDEMAVKAGVAQVLKDDEIIRDLAVKAKELDLPPSAMENLTLQRDNERRKMKISTKWDVQVRFFGDVYVKTFHFEPVVEESFMSLVR